MNKDLNEQTLDKLRTLRLSGMYHLMLSLIHI